MARILVVGAGPAGCSAAFFLKKFSSEPTQVLLIERLSEKSYLIYHDMCGEVTSESTLKEFHFKPRGVIKHINKIREFYPKNIVIETKIRGYLLNRSEFLMSIIKKFEELGGVFMRGRVENFSQRANYVKVRFNNKLQKFDYLIAADGPNSEIRKKLGAGGKFMFVLQYIVKKKPENVLKFYYDEQYCGDYKWEFPHEDDTKIGFPLNVKDKEYLPREQIQVKQCRAIAFGGLQKYSYGRILLVGDAACQANPLTKAGIRQAIVAGKLAAKAIIEGKPTNYDSYWKNSDLANPIFGEAYEMLKKMSNKELTDHIKPFTTNSKLISAIQILLRPKYWKLYQAYEKTLQFGW